MKGMWIYDIILKGKCVGNSGDFEFKTKDEARADADDYCISELSNEYGVEPRDFKINIYQSQH